MLLLGRVQASHGKKAAGQLKLVKLEAMSHALDILIENCKNGSKISINNCSIFGNTEINQKKERAK